VTDPIVLMYHAFGSRDDRQDPHRLFVPVDAFEQQLQHLVARRSNFLDLDGFLAGLQRQHWPARSVLLTIDDGYLSTLLDAAPLLRRYGVPAVLFALGGRLGGRSDWMSDMPHEPLLTAAQLRQLPDYGISVQCHGWDHRHMAGLDDAQLRGQMVDSRARLESETGARIKAFAYPSGVYDPRAVEAAGRAGYECAFAVHTKGQQRYAFRRTDVNATDTHATFRLKTQGWWQRAYYSVGRFSSIRGALHRAIGSAR